jgi:hypothetical protein
MQSAFAWHSTHAPTGEQIFVIGVAAQSAEVAHWTQSETIVLQTGTGAAQFALVLQPARQTLSTGSQMGNAEPQSAFERQATQRLSRARQRGALVGQSALAWHCTHCCVVGLHTGKGPPQSELELQPTHAPVEVLQMCASSGQLALFVHAALQS